MMEQKLKGKAIRLMLLGILLLLYPFIGLFESSDRLWGVPLFLLYLVVVWSVMIGLLFRLTQAIDQQESDHSDE